MQTPTKHSTGTVLKRLFEPAKNPVLHTPKTCLQAWWQACRPPLFIVDLIPLILALLLAVRNEHGLLPVEQWPWLRFFMILIGCFMVHTIANIANDVFDYALGTDTDDTIGGSRVIHEGKLSPRALTFALALLSLGALFVGMWLIAETGQLWLYGVMIFSLLSALFYVAPPIKYGYHGYGELSVAINMGLIMVCAAHAVLTNQLAVQTLSFGLVVGLMVAGILYYQSLPEIVTDREAGKNTLAVKLGKVRAEGLFQLWWPIIWLMIAILWSTGVVSWVSLLGILSFPLYWRACRHIRQATDWLELDQHGHLIRKLYLLNGLALIVGVAWQG